jgi:hypothetical protein
MITVFLLRPAETRGYRIDEFPTDAAVYVADAEDASGVPAVAVHCAPLATDGVQFGMTIPFGRNQAIKRRGIFDAVCAYAFRDQSAEGKNGSISVTPAAERNNRRDLLTPMLM